MVKKGSVIQLRRSSSPDVSCVLCPMVVKLEVGLHVGGIILEFEDNGHLLIFPALK